MRRRSVRMMRDSLGRDQDGPDAHAPMIPGRVMQSPSSAGSSHRVTSSITTLIWSLSRELQMAQEREVLEGTTPGPQDNVDPKDNAETSSPHMAILGRKRWKEEREAPLPVQVLTHQEASAHPRLCPWPQQKPWHWDVACEKCHTLGTLFLPLKVQSTTWANRDLVTTVPIIRNMSAGLGTCFAAKKF